MNKKTEKKEIEIVIIAKKVWKQKWFVIKCTVIALSLGIIIALSIPREFTCTVKMAAEVSSADLSGSVSGLAAMAGINLGTDNSAGISLLVYPDIVKSIPFIVELLNMPVTYQGLEKNSTLYDYIAFKVKTPWFSSVFSLPKKIFRHSSSGYKGAQNRLDPYSISKAQNDVIKAFQKRAIISIDKKTGILSAGVTLQDPVLAAVVSDSIVNKLKRFVWQYRTTKARRDFDYATKMFEDASKKYTDAQRRYAEYADANRNIAVENIRIEQDRLKNEVNITYGIYAGLAQQVESSRMKLQEQTPCVTIIEPARIPSEKSNMGRAKIVAAIGFLGFILSLIWISYPDWIKMRESI